MIWYNWWNHNFKWTKQADTKSNSFPFYCIVLFILNAFNSLAMTYLCFKLIYLKYFDLSSFYNVNSFEWQEKYPQTIRSIVWKVNKTIWKNNNKTFTSSWNLSFTISLHVHDANFRRTNRKNEINWKIVVNHCIKKSINYAFKANRTLKLDNWILQCKESPCKHTHTLHLWPITDRSKATKGAHWIFMEIYIFSR